MNIQRFLAFLIALSIMSVGIASVVPTVGAESMSIMMDQSVHALGEPFIMTVSYMGTVHGDMKLSIENSSGTVVNEWTWSHASSDPYQQSVSYAPQNAGMYTVKAVHQPHHMEPPVSTMAQITVWSAKILNLEYVSTVDAGKQVEVKANIDYYFTQPTQVKLELWSISENKNLGTVTQMMDGQGATTMTLANVMFSSVQSQDITARISYQSPSGDWMANAVDGTYNGQVSVVPEFYVTPTILLVLSLTGVGLMRRRISMRQKK